MKISDNEFRAFAAAAMVGIATTKGPGDAEGVVRASIKLAHEMRRQLLAIKEIDDYGESKPRSEGHSA